jgi:hypothetical protein
MPSASPANEIMEMILAGDPELLVASRLKELSPDERLNLLCTVCSIHDEMARNCVATGKEVNKLLSAECPYFVNSAATCLLE